MGISCAKIRANIDPRIGYFGIYIEPFIL